MKRLFLDFDGVLVRSNALKTSVFADLGKRYGNLEISDSLVAYHFNNPGMSRFEKLSYLHSILPKSKAPLSELISKFEERVESELLKCDRTQKIRQLIDNSCVQATIVSAAPQVELINFVNKFGWDAIFEDRIFGSPHSKYEILSSISELGGEDDYFVGDSVSDFEVSSYFGLKFIFISAWSDWLPQTNHIQGFHGTWATFDTFLEDFLSPSGLYDAKEITKDY